MGRGLPEPLLPPRGRQHVAVFCQPGSFDIASRIARGMEGADLHVMPDGEDAKSLSGVEAAYTWLAQHDIARHDTLVAVGGGALTDSAGFVAATWLRGIEAVYVPTTLLAAVDASIGGKTAVNFAGKNLVGVFRHPTRVVIDLEVLDELPVGLKREGAAEAVKAGLLADPRLVEHYLTDGVEADLARVVPAAVRVKADIVTEDFTEGGRRALLNFGHTLGHAIEFASRYSHGEAVALGMVAAAAISTRKLGWEAGGVVESVLDRIGLPTRADPSLDREEVRRLVALDKKRDSSGVRMVLLAGIGDPRLVTVDDDDIEAGLDVIGL